MKKLDYFTFDNFLDQTGCDYDVPVAAVDETDEVGTVVRLTGLCSSAKKRLLEFPDVILRETECAIPFAENAVFVAGISW